MILSENDIHRYLRLNFMNTIAKQCQKTLDLSNKIKKLISTDSKFRKLGQDLLIRDAQLKPAPE